ncbi:hypothetical protein AB0L40_08710 [Patulibacter sp. NPDC049589]|uniref:hypothetical protein n=1 Tax=Patulibacter sp. NPDC049589 TaxID=3154731 RepID=UPI00341BE2BE
MLRRSLPLAALTAVLAVPAGASAATRWGDVPDAGGGDPIACPTSCTLAQERYANQDLQDVLGPSARAVVTGWRVAGAGGEVRLRALGGTAATAWSPTASTATRPAQLPVAAGQLVAVEGRSGAVLRIVPPFFPSDADVVRRWSPALPDGAGPGGGTTSEGTVALALDIEPDGDGDGLGDETQDPDGGSPVVGDPGPGWTPDPGTPAPPAAPSAPTTPTAPKAPSAPAKKAGPKVPKAGPKVTLAKTAPATAKGVVRVTVKNPYGQALSGRVTVRRGKKAVGSAAVRVAADGSATTAVRLKPAGRTVLKRKRRLTVTVEARLKGPAGRYRTSSRTLTATVSKGTGGTTTGGGSTNGGSTNDGPTDDGGKAAGPDGTYRASDGQVMAVEGGKVVSFSGSLSLYCTRSGKQKTVAYSMAADDPAPTVGGDGSFAWEATQGYGFVKLKFEGRISGDAATGKLAVEDRSPLLGTGKIEFDYCYAGKEWSLQR